MKFRWGFEIHNPAGSKWKKLVGRLLAYLRRYSSTSSAVHTNYTSLFLSCPPSLSFHLHILDISHQMDHTAYDIWSLSSFSYHTVFEAHIVLVYISTLPLSMNKPTVFIRSNLSIHRWALFSVINIFLWISFLSGHLYPFLLGICLEVVLLGYMLILG